MLHIYHIDVWYGGIDLIKNLKLIIFYVKFTKLVIRENIQFAILFRVYY